jgi:hypothetical protein
MTAAGAGRAQLWSLSVDDMKPKGVERGSNLTAYET